MNMRGKEGSDGCVATVIMNCLDGDLGRGVLWAVLLERGLSAKHGKVGAGT